MSKQQDGWLVVGILTKSGNGKWEQAPGAKVPLADVPVRVALGELEQRDRADKLGRVLEVRPRQSR